jgi:DUF1680 family protein
VYCLESADLPKDQKVLSIALSAKNELTPELIKIENSDIMSLKGKAEVSNEGFDNKLYKEVSLKPRAEVNIRLIPYYAWGNRGHVDMETWIPFNR